MSNVRVCACLHSPFPHSAAGGYLDQKTKPWVLSFRGIGPKTTVFPEAKVFIKKLSRFKIISTTLGSIVKFSKDYFTLNFLSIVEWQSGESSTYSWRGERGERQGSWKEAGDRLKRGRKKKKKREREVFSLPLLHPPQPHMEAKTSDRVSKKLQLFCTFHANITALKSLTILHFFLLQTKWRASKVSKALEIPLAELPKKKNCVIGWRI